MDETITTTELLDFLVKANKISSEIIVTKTSDFYLISVRADWEDNVFAYFLSTYITAAGHSIFWDPEVPADHDFFTMFSLLDYRVYKKEERETKRRKREELLSRLTDEEKELLGV